MEGETSSSGWDLLRVRGETRVAGDIRQTNGRLPVSGRARHGSDDEVGETERGPDNQGGGGDGSEEGQKGLTGFLAGRGDHGKALLTGGRQPLPSMSLI